MDDVETRKHGFCFKIFWSFFYKTKKKNNNPSGDKIPPNKIYGRNLFVGRKGK